MVLRAVVLGGLLLVGALPALAHGGGHSVPPPRPAPPPPDPPPPITPTNPVPPGVRTPHDPTPPAPPPTPDDRPEPPTTPGGDPPAPPAPPPLPIDPDGTDSPPDIPSPSAPSAPAPRSGVRDTPRGATGADGRGSWRIWWEYNREYVLGLRSRIRASAVVTPGAGERADPLEARRDEIRDALRLAASLPSNSGKLRSASLIALGRLGRQDEVEVFLQALRHDRDPDVQSAAALGVGLLPPLDDPDVRRRVREHLEYVAAGGGTDHRVRGFAFVAMGMRARHDAGLSMGLARQCTPPFLKDGYDAATLAYACGIARDPVLLPELLVAARSARLGGRKLDDIGQAHAVMGLGLMPGPLVEELLGKLLRSRRAGIETRRAAALALGRHLREAEMDADAVSAVKDVLLQTLEKCHDPVLKSDCLIALGGAREPLALDRIEQELDRTGDPTTKPYAALALGLAAGRLGDGEEVRRLRRFLVEELEKTKDPEIASAVSLAAGLAGAHDAAPELIARVTKKSLPAPVRGSAAEALGLLNLRTKEVGDLLLEAARSGPPELLEGATLGLGMIGRRGIAPELVERLQRASSGILQGRLTLALGYLGQESAVDPLLTLLKDRSERGVVRELAAVALGLLADPRDDDVLFEVGAYFNIFATTLVTHELLTIF